MSRFNYDQRLQTYTNAMVRYGDKNQIIVALEELSECQKELCKFLRGLGDREHLTEEIADATIMLEQMRYIFCMNDLVCEKMDEKIQRLDSKLRKGE